ncbi:hypothetical protein Tco_1041189 [Tanacetum coccineum]|uniref:Reverse transcriptase domain-containing protein n=1 Tax=Tanacetum coccineum TaxID=301880 RepID=A0ABQ5GH60_9ASTR
MLNHQSEENLDNSHSYDGCSIVTMPRILPCSNAPLEGVRGCDIVISEYLRGITLRSRQGIASTLYISIMPKLNCLRSLNSAAGGNFLDKMPRECLKIIESKSKVRQSRNKAVVAKMSTSSSTPAVSSDVAELKDMVRALILDRKNQTPASAPVKRMNKVAYCPERMSCVYHYPKWGFPSKSPKAVNHVAVVIRTRLPPANNGSTETSTPVVQIQCLEGEITLRVGREATHSNLNQTSRYSTVNHMTVNKIDVIDMACESILNDFLLFEEADSFLALEDDPTSSEVDPTYQDPEGDILLLEAILNSEPPPPSQIKNIYPGR